MHLYVPVAIKIVNGCDTTSILIRIVYVFHVVRTVTRITSHHCLEGKIDFIERTMYFPEFLSFYTLDL